MKTLVTGAAGFIGMHSALRLLERGDTVVGIDDLNACYSPRLKQDRLAQLTSRPGFSFERLDVADAIVGVLDRPPEAAHAQAPHRVLNIGNQRPEPLAALIDCIERATGRTAQRRMRPMQDSDVADTCADVQQLIALTGMAPRTPLAQGVERFVAWTAAGARGSCWRSSA